jgi:hypothetical protein
MASTHVNLVRGSLNAMLALFLVVSSLLFTFAWWMREPSTSSNPWNPEFAQAVLDEHGDELNRLASSARSRENIGNWVHAEIETDSEPRKFSACADKNGNVFVLMDYNVFAECGMLLRNGQTQLHYVGSQPRLTRIITVRGDWCWFKAS